MKQKLYPLTFHPIYKEKIWGGKAAGQDLRAGPSPGSNR